MTAPPMLPRPDPRGTAVIVAAALFMQNLDSAAIATALPSMARDLGVEPARLGAAITAYLVALTVFIPVSGWVADRFGAKRVFLIAIVVFTVASALCGRATGLPELIAARTLQGLGGAMMVPVGRLLLLRDLKKEEMLSAMAWLTMPGLLGPVVGPPLGGLLTDTLGWRSVFLINLPIGVLGLTLAAWRIPWVPPSDPGPPDRIGLALVGSALATGMFGLETIGRGVVPEALAAGALLLGAGLGWAALRHMRRVPRPAIDLGLLAVPSFWQATVPGSLFRIGAGAAPFLVPLLLQVGFGQSASQAGLLSFATALGAFAMKPVIRPLLRRLGFRRAILGSTVLAAAAIAACAALRPGWPWAAVFALLMVGGLFRSLLFTSLNTLAFADVPGGRLSAATSFFGTAQQMTPALGIVLAGATLEVGAWLAGRHGTSLADFPLAFLVAGAVTLAALPFHLRMAPDAGAAVSGHGVGPPRAGP